ncbi:beta strand repeat-containing protein [Chryseobacterium taichungense]|uniref:beta strand repeat-containing protein n=1 Tax=Chryseobacterium taichungense TaxID=295069 RepID=UPI0028A8478E|nr:hypothetical protein [Chryseobacterium taichungense]
MDGDFLVWGSDTGSTTFSTPFAFNGLNYRMPRTWKMQKTGSIGIVKVAVPVSMWLGAVTQPTLLISGDAIFDGSDSNFLMKKETIGGIDYYVTDPINLNITSGQFFSFAGFVTAPGGILGEKLWLKADVGTDTTADGASLTLWNDQSGLNRNAGNANSVFFRAGNNNAYSANFNPTVDFTTTNSRIYNVTGGLISTSTASIHLFLISNPRSGASTDKMLGAFTNLGSSGSNNWNDLPSLRIVGSYHAEAGSTGGTGSTISYNPSILGTTALSSLSVNPSAGTVTLRQNGLQAGNLSGKSLQSGTQGYVLGNDVFGGGGNNLSALFTAGEVIAYEGELTGATLSKVESYLALKYGVTKSGDYISSDAVAYWNSTSNSGYQNNIAGIGRDDASGLNQKQSQSTTSGIQPVIGNANISDTNANNSNDFGADKTFMMWGSDTGSTNFDVAFAYWGLNRRMTRIWKVQETGTVGKVRVAFKVSDLPGSVTNPVLLISSNTTFNASSTKIDMLKETIGGVDYYVTKSDASTYVDFNSGQYFTFAAFITAPGGVLGATSWFKADNGTILNNGKVSTWSNQASNYDLVQLSQPTDSRQPAFITKGWNFNPNITFDGSEDVLDGTMSSLLNVLGSQNNDVFGILNVKGGANAKVYLQVSDDGNNSPRLSLENTIMHFPSTSSYISNTGLAQSDFPSIFNAASGAGNLSYALNGGSNATGTFSGTITAGTTPRYMVGGFRAGSGYSHFILGGFPEMMTYNRTLTPTEKKQVQTYLAIKYGQTVLHDYLASDGLTTIYNISSYNNNIAGIGRDDASALNQKQSQSVNSDIQPVIGNGDIADTNANNTSSFTADKSFLVWGSDVGSTSFATPFAYGSSNFRMTRIWKIQKTGTIGTVKVAIPVSQLPVSVTMPSLLISDDATFDGTDARKAMTQVSLGGVQYYVAEVDTNVDGFTSGHFFSFAGFVTAPGGVAGATLWLRADKAVTAGTNVSAWNDLSGNGRVVSQATAANQPVYNTANNLMNFNSSVGFSGSQYMSASSLFGSSSYTAVNAFSVAQTNAVQVGNIFFEQTTSPNYQVALWTPYSDNKAYWDGPYSSEISANWGGTLGTPYLWSGISAGNSQSLRKNGLHLANGTHTVTFTGNNSPFYLSLYPSNGYYNGLLGDVIIYNSPLTPSQIQNIQSYLSIKYGITITNDNNNNGVYNEVISGAVIEGNYTSSNSNVIWTGLNNVNYHNNIAGIGRDDASALLQKQSKSVNSGYQLIMGLSTVAATNAANTGTLTNLQFLVWGDNNQANTVDFTGIAGYNLRLKRVWKVQNTNAVNQDIQVLVPVDTSTVPGLVPASSSLLYSTDANFGTYEVRNPSGTVIINSISYLAFNLPASLVNPSGSNFYMTFAFYNQSPGGVRDNIALWLRGDKDLTTTILWKDQTSNHNDLQFSTYACNENPRGQMMLGETLNFNPVASFGDNEWVWGYTPANISRLQHANADVAIVYKTDGAYAQDVWGTDWGGAFDERSLTTTQIANDNTGIGYSGGNSGAATINVASFNGTAPSGSNVLINGNNVLNFTGSTTYSGCNNIRLGDVKGAGNVFKGVVGDMVVYQKNMSAIDRIQLNSYLALKYGITLGRNNDGNNTIGGQVSASPVQIFEGDYLASNGTTKTWSSDAVYQNNVVGLGRDDISAFHQRITTSQSATPDIITLSTDSNFVNTNQSGASGHTDIANDKFFFVTGNNNGALTYTVKSGLSNDLNALMNRVWKVKKTGTAQEVYIKTSNSKATYLVYSADPTFSSGGIGYVPLSGGVTTLGVNIPDGNYFTFATFLEAPGGVYTGLKIWHKADAGVTATSGAVTSWINQADEKPITNGASYERPTLVNGSAAAFNFNPYLSFAGSRNSLRNTTANLFSQDSDITNFFTSNVLPSSNGGQFWGIQWVGKTGGAIYDNFEWFNNSIYTGVELKYYSTSLKGAGQNVFTFAHSGATDRTSAYINTTTVMNNISNAGRIGAGGYVIGDDTTLGGDNYANLSNMSELIAYNRVLEPTELKQVQSYLALKTGITLPQNHLASDGTTIFWNAGGGYDNNIIGLAKDNTSTLHQRIAKSQMPVSDIIILSTDNNFTNANQSGASGHADIANDRYFFITGHNGQPTTFTLKSGLDNSLNAIMNRVWKVQQTGTPQNVFVKVDNVRATYLIYSTDPTFSSNVTYKALASGVAAGVQIPTGNYFTFAAPLNGPGGVTDNLVRWYRADRDVVTGSTLTWKDQTINADATQSVAVNQPVYNTSGASLLNFNQSFTFDASQSDFMSFSDAGMANGKKVRSVFGVGRTSVTGGTFEWLTSYGTSNSEQNFGLMRSGNNVLVTSYSNDFYPYNFNNPYASNTPVISYGAASTGTLYGTYNALPILSGSYSVDTALNIGRIGTRQSGGENWNGLIGEVIYYNTIPSSTDKQRIDSYLGLKYGVTLGNTGSTFNYLDSAGNTFWTGNATYQNNIAGIGRDDISDLNQKQSQSQDQTKSSTLTPPLTRVPQVIIGLGSVAATNEANTGSFDTNLQFLVWGDNNANLEGDVPTPFTAVYPYQERLSRVWRVQNTKNLSKDIQVLIPATYIKNLKVSSLLYSTDATFPTGSQVFDSSSTGVITINSVDYKAFTIPAAQVNKAEFFFTMAYYQKSPGGVAGENLWLRADDEEIAANADNTSVATWKDQSGNNSHGTQSVPGQQPKYRNNATDNMNFNPVLAFNGGQNFDITGTLGINGQKNVSVFAVSDILGAHYFLQPKVAGGNLLQFSSAGAGSVNLTLGGSSATNTTAAPSGGSAELYSGWRTAAGDVLYSGINAKQLNAVANSTNWTGGNLVMGIDASGNATNGKIPEMVEYSSSLNATQLQKVNSYLALKYGITINQSTTGQDYLASDGSKSWTADATYKYNIAGIGRDDLTALNQKQSQSVNTGDSQILIALGTAQVSNAANTNTFSSDMQYLVWGDDNGSLTTKVATGNVTANGLTYTKRFSRVWKTQNKGSFASDIKVYFPVSAFANVWSSSVGLIYASTAAKLSDGTASVIANTGTETINGVSYYTFPVEASAVPSLNYLSFTTATSVCYKPAVTSGTALATKAGITALGRAGVNADNWPMVRKGGWMALEAKTKGMIINRVRFNDSNQPVDDTETTPILTNAVEGMIVMDLTNRMLKVYTVKNGVAGWYEIGQQTCPD